MFVYRLYADRSAVAWLWLLLLGEYFAPGAHTARIWGTCKWKSENVTHTEREKASNFVGCTLHVVYNIYIVWATNQPIQ